VVQGQRGQPPRHRPTAALNPFALRSARRRGGLPAQAGRRRLGERRRFTFDERTNLLDGKPKQDVALTCPGCVITFEDLRTARYRNAELPR
jgi:hypothetical protein